VPVGIAGASVSQVVCHPGWFVGWVVLGAQGIHSMVKVVDPRRLFRVDDLWWDHCVRPGVGWSAGAGTVPPLRVAAADEP